MSTPRPKRRTWKGHGNATQGTYYGHRSKPDTTGIRVTITKELGRLILTDHSPGYARVICACGTSSKFWMIPD